MKKCPDCEVELTYNDFRSQNKNKYTEEELKKLWESPYLCFLCCKCFAKREIEAVKEIVDYIDKMEKDEHKQMLWEYALKDAEKWGMNITEYLLRKLKFMDKVADFHKKHPSEITDEDIDRYFNGGYTFQEIWKDVMVKG